MAEPIAAMCDELIKAVNVMMDAASSQRYRLEALKVASWLVNWITGQISYWLFSATARIHGYSGLSGSTSNEIYLQLSMLWLANELTGRLTMIHSE